MSLPGLSVREQDAVDPGTRPRILVADDSRVMRLAIEKILGTDFEIIQVENGTIAWERICGDDGIQAVLTDMQMPQMDGYELICRIRAATDARVRELPVMAITGSDDNEVKQQAMACGATDFIIKPIDPLQLRARVQAYVHYDQTTRDLTEKSASLKEQAITDPQTGLRSRRYLMQRGEQDIAYARRHVRDLTLLRIDIDGFKQIYRKLGDEASDRLIVWLAKLLHSTARTEDTTARVSGAEFAILAMSTSHAEVGPLCERIRAAVRSQPFSFGNVSVPVTLSIGAAGLSEDGCDTVEAMYKLAYQRMCHAVSEGGDRVCYSILGDGDAPVEEVLLAAVAEPEVIEPASADLAEAVEGVGLADEPVTAEAVAPLTDEHETTSRPAGLSSPVHTELMGVDKALALLAQGKSSLLLPYLDLLLREIQPLLDLHNKIRK